MSDWSPREQIAFERGRRQGFIEGSEAGVKIAADATKLQTPTMSYDPTLKDRIRDLEAELREALDNLFNMVSQDCSTERGYDSMAISTYADAMQLLVKHGLMEYVSTPSGRMVLCRAREKE